VRCSLAMAVAASLKYWSRSCGVLKGYVDELAFFKCGGLSDLARPTRRDLRGPAYAARTIIGTFTTLSVYNSEFYGFPQLNSLSKQLILPVLAMAIIIVASNILVTKPINDWLVWGTLTYPFAFLVTDLTNRRLGPASARMVVYFGFAVGVAASFVFADLRIAMASGTAFLIAQLFDVSVFDKLRDLRWWIAPLVSSIAGTVLDTFLFFSLAFYATEVPWVTIAIGDLGVKLAVTLFALGPYGLLMAARRTA